MANDQKLASLLDRLESVTNRLEKIPVGRSSQSVEDEGNTEIVEAFDQSVQPDFNTFNELSNQIGDDVSKHAELVKKAIEAQRALIVTASKYKRPDQSALQKLLLPLSNAISAVQDFREKNRSSKQFNHLSAVSEFIPCLGWVAVNPRPVAYIKQMFESTQFYSNKVLKDFKQTDPKQAEWAKLFAKLTSALSSYVSDFHTTGLTWNVDGKAAPTSTGASPAPPPPTGAGPAPPPPPPPVAAPVVAPKPAADKRSALLSELNRGDAVTKGLKKVTNDMKTHKNPALRASGAVPDFGRAKPVTAPKPSAKSTPICRLEGKKWIVEHHHGNQDLVISETTMKQTVYIYKCDNSVIQIKGKVNSIALDSCKKTVIIFDDVISLVDFVNCQSVKAQANGTVPTISIGKTDGIQVYCSSASMKATIISSKSSEMNILIPGEDGDMIESAVPEQFRTVWNESKKCFVTDEADIAS